MNIVEELYDAASASENPRMSLEGRAAETIESLRQQVAANNPLLDEAADELDRQKAEIESLRQQLASRDAEVHDLKVVSDHNLATYHQAAELLRAEIADLRRAGLEWHGKFITETAATELLREQVTLLRDVVKFWMKAEGNYDLMKSGKKFQEALAATEPK